MLVNWSTTKLYIFFVSIKDILDPNKGFMKEGKITVEAKIQVQSNG